MSDSVSIIVPTRNRSAILARCLAALPAGAYGLERPELIVVDDCSTDTTGAIVQEFCTISGWPARYIALDRPYGANAARNAALRIAQGEIIAFIDDDVLVPEGWLSKLVSGLSIDFPVVSGPVRLMMNGPLLGKHREEMRAFLGDIPCLPLGFDGQRIPVLGNFATYRRLFQSATFDELLQPPVEEADWLRRSGANCGFVADAWVWHYKTPEDVSPRKVLTGAWRRGGEGGWWLRERIRIPAADRWKLATRSGVTSFRAFSHAFFRRCWGGLVIALGELSRALALVGVTHRRPRAGESWR